MTDRDRRRGGSVRSSPATGVSWRAKVEAFFGVDVRSLAVFRCGILVTGPCPDDDAK